MLSCPILQAESKQIGKIGQIVLGIVYHQERIDKINLHQPMVYFSLSAASTFLRSPLNFWFSCLASALCSALEGSKFTLAAYPGFISIVRSLVSGFSFTSKLIIFEVKGFCLNCM